MKLIKSFEQHLRSIVLSLLSDRKVEIEPLEENGEENRDNIVKYIAVIDNQKRKKVYPKPRKVKYSKQFLSNPKLSECSERIHLLEKYLESGDKSINDPENHFLSKNVEYIFNRYENSNWLFIDKMLYEWGIMHFHLGKERRTNDLLFAMIDDDYVYFIDIRGHDSLYEQELLNIVFEHWPHLLDFLDGIEGDNLTVEEVKNLRSKNIGYAPNIGKRAFCSKEMLSAAGYPIRIVRDVDYYCSKLEEVEQILKNQESVIYKDIQHKLGYNKNDLIFECIQDFENLQKIN